MLGTNFKFSCIYVAGALALALQPDFVFAKRSTKDKNATLEELKYAPGDETGNEVKALKTELLVSKAEIKAIEQLKKLIRKNKGSKLEAELHFRLAELYMRRSKTDRFFEIHRQSETVVNLAPRLVQNASSRKTIELAIASYEYIQKNYPRFQQMDLTLFNNAFARQGLGQDKEAEKLYWTLIQKFPTSPLVPDCHLAVGEINFDRGNFKFALDHFKAIRKFPESRVYPYGLYKSAWALYNLREPEAGLKVLEEVVDYGKFVAQKKIVSRLDLRKEAIIDMTTFYEDVYPAADAFKYFRAQAGDADVGAAILRLAKLYDRHSRYRDMQVVLEDFIKYLPNAAVIASIQNELAWNYDNQKLRDKSILQMQKLAELCQPDSEWMLAQETADGSDPAKLRADLLKQCKGMFAETTLKLAGKWLKIWKKTMSSQYVEYADSAEKAFNVYLRYNPTGKEAAEARYAYAELLFQREKFREASNEYALVFGSDVSQELMHDANYAALLSLEKAVKDKWSDSDEKQFLSLAKAYVKANPQGKYRLDVEFRLALIAYEKERYDEAAPVFKRLGREFVGQEKGQKSQDLYLDILNLKKDYKALREYSRELMAQQLGDERMKKLTKLHEQAYFLEIQSLEEKQDYSKALSAYSDFVKANPQSELVEKALWNSMNLNYKIGQQVAGANMAVELSERFPGSKENVNVLLRAVQTYESTAQLETAANVLIKLSRIDTANMQKWQTLAADFYALSGRWILAKKYYTELLAKGDAKLRRLVLEKMYHVEKLKGTEADQTAVLKQMIAAGYEPQSSQAKLKALQQMYKDGRVQEAFLEAKRLIAGSDVQEVRAGAHLIQARILEDEFLAQSVKSRADKVAMVLAIKTEKLEKAQKSYQSTIRYGDNKSTVEALKRLAGCYQHYVTALREMPAPAGLSAEEAKMFRDEIQQLIIPLEEKGVESLNQALTVAHKAKLRDGTVAELKRDLNKMNMRSDDTLDLGLEVPSPVVPTTWGVGS